LRISGVPKAQVCTRTRAAAETRGLTDLLARKPSQLSAGDQVFARLQDGTRLNLHKKPAVAGTDIQVGLRPEHLNLAPEAANNSIPGKLQILEPTGAVNRLKVSVAGTQLTVVDDTLADLSMDAPVHLTIASENIHVFPKPA
jgi:ABC-type sugar transport system ATPase subunit